MENEKISLHDRILKSRINGQKMRSITPCLMRNDQMVEQIQIKKQFSFIQQNALLAQQQQNIQKQQSGQLRGGNGFQLNNSPFNNTDLEHTNSIILQAQGLALKRNQPTPSKPNLTEHTFQLYKDIFNNENNRFRSLTSNNRWVKKLGNIRQKNENSYIINQIQNKKLLANENKDEFIITNYWEQKKQEKQQQQQQDNFDNNSLSNCSPLPTLPISPNSFQVEDQSMLQQVYLQKYHMERLNNQQMHHHLPSNNPTISQQDSPEKSVWIPSPKYSNKKQKNMHELSNDNLIKSPEEMRGGETAHFNNFLQNTMLEHIQRQKQLQSRKISFGQTTSNNRQDSMKRNSLFDNSFIVQKQKPQLIQLHTQNSKTPTTRSVTPSLRPNTPSTKPLFMLAEQKLNQNFKKQRQQLQLNKSNINFFAERCFSPTTCQSKNRAHTQEQYIDDNNIQDNLFVKYNDENIFEEYQSWNIPKRNQSKQSIKVWKDAISQIVLPENTDYHIEQSKPNLQNHEIIHATNMKIHQKNPSVVQYTPKSTMQKFSKIPRFIPVKNRIIRYPAFINIMHNTTHDQTIEILRKNKLLTNDFKFD